MRARVGVLEDVRGSAGEDRDPSAALDDLREVVTTLEDTERIAQRVLGGAHPEVMDIERKLRQSRAALRARETPPSDSREDGDLDGVENA